MLQDAFFKAEPVCIGGIVFNERAKAGGHCWRCWRHNSEAKDTRDSHHADEPSPSLLDPVQGPSGYIGLKHFGYLIKVVG